jgi:SHS family lactate transporter-like MFS transporter
MAVLAGFLGWTLDAFDFFLVAFCLKDIAKTFGVSDDKIGWCTWATLFMRPVGALIFGLLADRYGRRKPLMINLIFFSSLSILSGIGMGGEWGVGASLAMEKVPARFRGVLSGVLQEGYAVGNLLAAGAYFFLFPRLSHWLPHIDSWRPLFWIGGLPAILAFFVRYHVKESEVWEKISHRQKMSNLWPALIANWRVFLLIVITMLMMNLSSHGTQDLFPLVLKDSFHLTRGRAAVVNSVAAVGMIFGGITIGLLSDQLGRRRAIVGSLLLAGCTVPIWAFAPSLGVLIVGAFAIQFFVQGAWGVIPAHITELSPDSVRGFLPGFGYQCGAAISGFIVPLQFALAKDYKLSQAMGFSALAIFIIAAIVIGLTSERRGIQFGQDAPA